MHLLSTGLSTPRLARAALLVALAAPLSAQSLLGPREPRNDCPNGGLENPAVEPGASLELLEAGAWTGSGAFQLWNGGPLGAVEGEQYLELHSGVAVSTACATTPGQAYALSFEYSPDPAAPEVVLEVRFAEQLLDTIVVPAGSPAGWSARSYTVVGATLADVLELRCLTPDPLGVGIDDVRLTPWSPAATEQLLRNWNLEDDPQLEPGTSLANPVFKGWVSLDGRPMEVVDLGGNGNGFNGKNVLDLADGLTVAQRVWVVPGEEYSLSLAFSPNPSDDRPRSFRVSFDGQEVDTISPPGFGAMIWSQRTYTVRSSRPLALLELQDLSGGPNGALLDALRLVGPAPEPELDGTVLSHVVYRTNTMVGLNLAFEAMFARGMCSLGDLDGDGVQDMAIGSVGDDDGAPNAGAVWILFLNLDRSIKSVAKISETSGGLVADFNQRDGFGRAVSLLGDLDLDGVPDMIVGANEVDSNGRDAGAAFVLFLNRDGSVKAQHRIDAFSGDALAVQPGLDFEFGASVAGLGDVDGDGIPDVAIGARFANLVQVCFLNRDGTVRAATALGYGYPQNGFDDTLTQQWDLFGMSCANMGDFDGDGINDLLVGAYGRVVDGQPFVGELYLLLLNPDGTAKRWFKYGPGNLNSRSQTIGRRYEFAASCAGIGDVDGDGVRDILVGAHRDGTLSGLALNEGTKKGAAYVLLLNASGTVKTCQRIGHRSGGLEDPLPNAVRWGESVAALGDHDGDGLTDVAIGSRFFYGTGAAFLVELEGERPRPARADFVLDVAGGLAPLAVQFGDRSSGPVTSWAWDFGDGGTSTEPSPLHVYQVPGTYTVSLTVGDAAGGSDTRTLVGLVDVSDPTVPVVAAFSATPVQGTAPLVVQFEDLSTGPVSSWAWDFGDGSFSSEPSPSHEYAASGVYTVSLTVGGLPGVDTLTQLDLVSVLEPGPLPAGVELLGCGVNPPGSFLLLSGEPRLGTTMVFGIDNPLGTQSPGATAILLGSWNPDPATPCGTVHPNRGMAGAGAGGEILNAPPASLSRRVGGWAGPGNPVEIALDIPLNTALLGRTMYVQGRLLDESPGAEVVLGYADGLALTFGL